MRRSFAVVGVTPPADGKFMSHALRIGAHTEHALIGIPQEARMDRFGWGLDSS